MKKVIFILILGILFLGTKHVEAQAVCGFDAPIANNDSYTVNKNQNLIVEASDGVLKNDTGENGFTLSVSNTNSISKQPTHGSVRLNNDGSFRYSPDIDFFGTDSFSYNITDGCADNGVSAVVSIFVDRNNHAPEIVLYGNNPEDLDLGLDIPDTDFAKGIDIEDGDLTSQIQINSNVNKNVRGKYEIVYSVKDSDNVFAYATRTVRMGFQNENTNELCTDGIDNDFDDVKDYFDSKCPNYNTAPTISLIGSDLVNLFVGNTFTDTGAIATDPFDGDITNKLATTTNFDKTKSGTYSLVYSVKNTKDIFSYATRTIVVATTTESTSEKCKDTFDNDGDGKVDLDDTDCSAFVPVTAPVVSGGGSSSSSGGGGGGSVIFPISTSFATSTATTTSPKVGKVLGESTSCGALLNLQKDYLARNHKNNFDQLILLKKFLNKNLGLDIPLDENFGPRTEKAVKDFQTKYKDQILKPWGIKKASGMVYISTANYINYLECPSLGFTVNKKDLVQPK